MPKRRPPGRGTKVRRGRDKWLLGVTTGYDAQGKQLREWETFHGSSTDADKRLDELVDRFDRSPAAASGMTLRQFCERKYLPYVRGLERAPKTVEGYESKLRTLIYPTFGERVLDSIPGYDVDMWLITMKKRPNTSETSRAHAYRVLNQVMNQAVAWEFIDRHHCKRHNAPRIPERPDFTVPDEAHVKRILDAFVGHALEPAVVLGLHGFRRSESMGVDWPAVTLKPVSILLADGSEVEVPGTVAITGGRQRVKGEGIILTGTKTAKSERVAALTSWGVDALKRHRKVGGPVLQRDDGRPLDPDDVTKGYRARMEESKVPFVHLKDLRHTFGTIAVERGMPLWMVAEAMGHSTQRTTEKWYFKPKRGTASAQVAKSLDDLYGG